MKIYVLNRCDEGGSFQPRIYTTKEAAVARMMVEYEDTKNIFEPNFVDKAEIGDDHAKIFLKRHDTSEKECFDRWDIWECEVDKDDFDYGDDEALKEVMEKRKRGNK